MMDPVMTLAFGAPVGFESELTRLRGGDLDALTVLVERYQNRLYRYLLRLVKQPGTAEDLFQQTWIRVMERIRSYDPQRSFEAWLFSVAHNLAIDYLRRYRPESLDEPLPSGQSREELLPGTGPSALERLLAHEQKEWLAEAMTELPVVYREVLTLRFEEEMKLEEIATVLVVPLSTVKTRLHRGLKGLRQVLGKKLEIGTQI
jgi:RNA polymerase sigma-70 factor (ECF subfamily)